MSRSRRLFYNKNHEWALKMTFRYLGKYELTVATVHNVFFRLFRSNGQPYDNRWIKEIFIKAAVDTALREAAQDTPLARAAHVQTYLQELAVRKEDGDDSSKYRDIIVQLLLLPLYPRLAYNICVIESCSGNEAALLMGIDESQVAGYVQQARTLLKNAIMAF